MRFPFVALLCLVAACTPSAPREKPSPAALEYSVIDEKPRSSTCVEPPAFFVADDEEGWVDAVAEGVACEDMAGDVEVPSVDFESSIAIAAWWAQAPCLGYRLSIDAVMLIGRTVTVDASLEEPQGDVCATAIAFLPTFLRIERSPGVAAATKFLFSLDGEQVGVVDRP